MTTTLQWSDALALSEPHIDATHQEFVTLLHAVEAALAGPEAEVLPALDAFIAHTDAHFQQEDGWMALIGFEPENCHVGQHRHVLQVLHDVRGRHAAEPNTALLAQLLRELSQWFPQHVQQMDAALAEAMRLSGLDVASGTVKHRAVKAEAASTCGADGCA